jgi:hypothetical protein
VTLGALAARAEEPKLPDECKAFARSQRARLASVWGGYAWKHQAEVDVLAFVDPRTVLAASEREVVLWEKASGREVRALSVNGPVVLSPDGKRLLVAGDELRLLDLTGKQLWSVPGAKQARF